MAGAEVLTDGNDGNRMRCACIDIGTNTTRLLVAERDGGRLREVVAERRFLRLAGGRDGAIAPETVHRLGAVVAEQVRLAERHGAPAVRVVATAAIRRAPNRDELCRAVARAAGVEVEVLTGREEAALAFAGAIATLDDGAADGLLGVVDVGGGSSELVTGTRRDGVAWWASLSVGSGVLADRHLRSDPPALDELAAVRAEVDAALVGVAPPAAPRTVLAVGGSATSLAAAGGELAPETIARVLSVLIEEPAAQAARRLGLHVERVRLLPAGLLLLEAAWSAFGGAPLHVAKGGLREGVVLQALDAGS
ncbi:MAG: exopolyphosphatase / guanosine-5-triphosphate,3-diphosphate pyrophosphatase [Solirubrobacteraceae bacterium]|jgi:exopolyphosphatase/guanosine-5'-triphosphate,3'-diphosphate pyrophosphatase|nr:exopolyphosphatase / guanosine-5-triphosphate,3-diphosphate pyrophosphatase [Solirubrobacteraceae bacterium]